MTSALRFPKDLGLEMTFLTCPLSLLVLAFTSGFLAD
jgi:hypothetical protein